MFILLLHNFNLLANRGSLAGAPYHVAEFPYDVTMSGWQYWGGGGGGAGNCGCTCQLAAAGTAPETLLLLLLLPPPPDMAPGLPEALPPVLPAVLDLWYGEGEPHSSSLRYSSIGLSMSVTENGVVCAAWWLWWWWWCGLGLSDIARSALLSSGSRSPELSENTADAADEAAVTERATFAVCPKNLYPEKRCGRDRAEFFSPFFIFRHRRNAESATALSRHCGERVFSEFFLMRSACVARPRKKVKTIIIIIAQNK